MKIIWTVIFILFLAYLNKHYIGILKTVASAISVIYIFRHKEIFWYFENRNIDIIKYRKSRNESIKPLDIVVYIYNSPNFMSDIILFLIYLFISFLVMPFYTTCYLYFNIRYSLAIAKIYLWGGEINLKNITLEDILVGNNPLKSIKNSAKINSFGLFYKAIKKSSKIDYDLFLNNYGSIFMIGKPIWVLNTILYLISNKKIILNDIKKKSMLICIWVFFDSSINIINKKILENLSTFIFIDKCRIYKDTTLKCNGIREYSLSVGLENMLYLNRICINPIHNKNNPHIQSAHAEFGETQTHSKYICIYIYDENNKRITKAYLYEEKSRNSQYYLCASPSRLICSNYELNYQTLKNYDINTPEKLLRFFVKNNYLLYLNTPPPPTTVILQDYKENQEVLNISQNDFKNILFATQFKNILEYSVVQKKLAENEILNNPDSLQSKILKSSLYFLTHPKNSQKEISNIIKMPYIQIYYELLNQHDELREGSELFLRANQILSKNNDII